MDSNDRSDSKLAANTAIAPPLDSSVDKGLLGDLEGGLAAALIALPPALGNGALVFLPLAACRT